MPSVIKSLRVEQLDGVVVIPDGTPPLPPVSEEEPEAAPQQETPAEVAARVEEMVAQARQTAQQQAAEILERARLQQEELLSRARQEAEQLKQQAREEGFGAAKAEMRQEIEDCMQQVADTMDQLQERQTFYMKRYQRELGSLAADVASKLIARRIAADETELVELVRRAVATVKNAEWISVEISDKLTELTGRLQEEFSSPAYGGRVEVTPRPMPADSCILQTPDGVVDASVPTQVENLRQAFADLLQN